MLNGESCGPSVDIWACGVILYVILCGFPPFYSDDDEELLDMIRSARVEFPAPYWDGVGPEAKDLIKKMLTVSTADRLTAEKVMDHPWLASDFPHRTEHLAGALDQLNKYNTRRRIKSSLQSIVNSTAIKEMVLHETNAANLWNHRETENGA
jgi:serine/threonine protein kinase